ncbi:MAG: hypothetical protein JW727_06930 [Candidatus Aenigmarchaeota archaeon]|nr:hypothetical protein [Candidatus Aenigmarchaeota archaeon]
MKCRGIVALFGLLLSVFFAFSACAFADGGLFRPSYDDLLVYELQDMNNQVCAINYAGGMERMLLSIESEDFASSGAVWIFPVPAKPDDVLIDTFNEFPSFYGNEVGGEAKEKVSESLFMMSLTQVYTFPIGIPFWLMGTMSVSVLENTKALSGYDSVQGVMVYEHLEKLGLTTELITAEDKESFYRYLLSKNLTIPEKFNNVAETYLEKDYSFVVSWYTGNLGSQGDSTRDPIYRGDYCCRSSDRIPYWSDSHCDAGRTVPIELCEEYYWENYPETYYDYKNYPAKRLSIFVSFPTEKIFFPMKLTSTYESKVIPMKVYVLGHVTPEVYSKIKPYATTTYQVSSYAPYSRELSSFYGGSSSSVEEYTKIEINAPSKYLIDDLWIASRAPLKVALADVIYEHTFWWALVTFLVLSAAASFVAGTFLFRKNKPDGRKFALLGLANSLTIIGYLLAAYVFKVESRFTSVKETVKAKVSHGEIMFKAFLASVALSILPMLILALSTLPRLLRYPSLFDLMEFLMAWPVMITFLLLFILPVTWGYYKNKNLLKLTILFSVIFLAMIFATWIFYGLLL